MKKWWNKLERALERIGRGKKLAVNLALCTFLLVLIWSRFGYPLPTAELEFRRMERTHLLPRSEIVFSNEARGGGRRVSGSDRSVFALDGTELYLRGRYFAGTLGDRAVLACLDRSYNSFIREIPLDGGAERTGGGWPLENGLWLLGVEDGEARARDQVSELPYTLRLYGASDTLLSERSGTLWEEESL